MKKNKLIFSIVLAMIMAVTMSIPAVASAKTDNTNGFKSPAIKIQAGENTNNDDAKEINSVKELKNVIEDEGNITKKEAAEILSETEPKVLAKYTSWVDTEASNMVAQEEPIKKYVVDGDKTVQVYSKKIDELTKVEVTLTDQEDLSPGQAIVGAIKNVIFDDVYAATNGETMWKKYGKRYLTAKYRRYIGSGYAVMCTENHYTVSKNGLDERYGRTWVDNMFNLTGDLTKAWHTIEDRVARSANADIHIRANMTFKYKVSVPGVTKGTAICTFYERIKIQYIKKDAKNKRIKVKQSWSKTDL